MRRWMSALAVTGAVVLGATGCAPPGGTDGDLTNDWAPLGEPAVFTPAAETCHSADFSETVYLSSYLPVDCATNHRLETVHVGTFAGAAGELEAPPKPGSAQFGTAYAECDDRARGFLGADWRTGRLWLGVALPAPIGWTAGARWFRCDLTELANVEEDGDAVGRTATLKGALREAGPLHLGCYRTTLTRNRTVDRMTSVECSARHNAEFAGVWRAPATLKYPTADRDWQTFYDGCYTVAARYVGVSQSTVRFRTGVVVLPGGPDDWTSGNRGVRCYLWISDRTFTRSLKGAGPAGLPIRTG
ncbi:septum formation family protein [Plantactinospora sp. WMMB334]|uniref:septum formation family protein n=1 Tax=Plantactinospora sp. WMMB334 TaxID=3404119 RepID=UPI003B943068